MRLSAAAIAEFQELYRKNYGEELSAEQAAELGQNLVEVVRLCLQAKRQ